jgi:hypothetical protein
MLALMACAGSRPMARKSGLSPGGPVEPELPVLDLDMSEDAWGTPIYWYRPWVRVRVRGCVSSERANYSGPEFVVEGSQLHNKTPFRRIIVRLRNGLPFSGPAGDPISVTGIAKIEVVSDWRHLHATGYLYDAVVEE